MSFFSTIFSSNGAVYFTLEHESLRRRNRAMNISTSNDIAEKEANITLSDNALISAIHWHRHTHTDTLSISLLWKRAKTIAITRTKTTRTISHARNRHLIVPSRTSERRRTKEAAEATRRNCTGWYKTNWSVEWRETIEQRSEMTSRIPRWISRQGEERKEQNDRPIDSMIDLSSVDPMVDNTWEISTSLMIIKWNESSQKRRENEKMSIRPTMMTIRLIIRFLLSRRHTVKSTRQWDEAEAAMLTLSSWKISLQLQDEPLRQIRTIGPKRVKDSWWSKQKTRRDRNLIVSIRSCDSSRRSISLVSWHLFVD